MNKPVSDHSTLSTIAALIARGLKKYGCDSRSLFRKAGLDPEKLKNPDARYSVKKMQSLWRLAVEETGQEAFGILLMKDFPPATLQGLGFAWLASDTLRDAINRLERYAHFISTVAHFALLKRKGKYHLVFSHVPDYLGDVVPASQDAALALVVQMCRLSVDPDLVPLQVDLSHKPPRELKTYNDFFRAPLNFSAKRNALVFDPEQIEKTLVFSNPKLARANDQTVVDYLDRFDRENIAQKVRIQIIDYLPSGVPSQKKIAQSLNLSLRSMQRQLQREKTTFKSALEDIRKTLARQYLKNSPRSIGEIAYLLGFSEPSSFVRAFKALEREYPIPVSDLRTGSNRIGRPPFLISK